MSIDVTTITLARADPSKTYHARSFSSADVVDCEEILAAHATKPYYLERIVLGADVDGVIDVGSGETSSAVTTVALQFLGTATGMVYDLSFKDNPIKLVAANSITIDGPSTSPVAGLIVCFTMN